MELLESFGINFKLLLSQVVNFFILLLILYKLVYKPLINLLDQRQKTIKESLEKADQIKQKEADLETREKEIVVKAKEEAYKIIQTAKEEGDKIRAEAHNKAKEESKILIDKTQETLKKEKEMMLDELKGDVADLAVLVSKQVIQREINSEIDQDLIKKAIKEARN